MLKRRGIQLVQVISHPWLAGMWLLGNSKATPFRYIQQILKEETGVKNRHASRHFQIDFIILPEIE